MKRLTRAPLVAIAIAVLALMALVGVAIGPGSGNAADKSNGAEFTVDETVNVLAEEGEAEEADEATDNDNDVNEVKEEGDNETGEADDVEEENGSGHQGEGDVVTDETIKAGITTTLNNAGFESVSQVEKENEGDAAYEAKAVQGGTDYEVTLDSNYNVLSQEKAEVDSD